MKIENMVNKKGLVLFLVYLVCFMYISGMGPSDKFFFFYTLHKS